LIKELPKEDRRTAAADRRPAGKQADKPGAH
jgi:hypothetical protein